MQACCEELFEVKRKLDGEEFDSWPLACMFSLTFVVSLNRSVVADRAIPTVATTIAVHRANKHLEVWRHSHAHGSIGHFIPKVP